MLALQHNQFDFDSTPTYSTCLNINCINLVQTNTKKLLALEKAIYDFVYKR
jgi:hypothetical protein